MLCAEVALKLAVKRLALGLHLRFLRGGDGGCVELGALQSSEVRQVPARIVLSSVGLKPSQIDSLLKKANSARHPVSICISGIRETECYDGSPEEYLETFSPEFINEINTAIGGRVSIKDHDLSEWPDILEAMGLNELSTTVRGVLRLEVIAGLFGAITGDEQ